MVKTKVIVLNSNQIVELLHDYVVTKARTICYDKSLNQMGTQIFLEKENVEMLGCFSRDNEYIYNRYKLLERLPHTGFRNFIMSNKQIEELLNSDKVLTLNQIEFEKEYYYQNVPKNHIRFITLNEEEMIEILLKQIFEYVGNIIGFHTTNYNAGVKINFDGDNSLLIYYCSNSVLSFNVSKLLSLNFNTISSFNYKFIDLSDSELKEVVN